MGYGYQVWAVDTERLAAAVGSGDDALARAVGKPYVDMLMEGPPYEMVPAHELHYAFEALTDHLGEFLDNSALYPSGLQFPDQVDAALKELGVTAIALSKLSYGRLPVELPPVDDFPGSGSLSAEQVREAKAQLEGKTYAGDDADVRAAIGNVRTWLDRASALGVGLVGFFH